MAMPIAQIRSSAYKYSTGAVTGTSGCDDSFKEKWDSVKENSQSEKAMAPAIGRASVLLNSPDAIVGK
jgi:hypothetical protein